MTDKLKKLMEAETKAAFLFKQIEERQFIRAGITEKELNIAIYDLAYELFGIKKYWHKRIVRAGQNTLFPYRVNPPNLILQDDEIVFLDFGPVFEEWEADFGRTFVLGNNSRKTKLKRDVELAWHEGKEFYQKNKNNLTGAQLYEFTSELAKSYGWAYGNIHCGHLIGNFPHEKIQGEDIINYIHPDNHQLMCELDKNHDERYWIYEIHFIAREQNIGGFFEQIID